VLAVILFRCWAQLKENSTRSKTLMRLHISSRVWCSRNYSGIRPWVETFLVHLFVIFIHLALASQYNSERNNNSVLLRYSLVYGDWMGVRFVCAAEPRIRVDVLSASHDRTVTLRPPHQTRNVHCCVTWWQNRRDRCVQGLVSLDRLQWRE